MIEGPLSDRVKRLAIVCPSWVGDTVMATPVLRLARQRLPDAEIVVVVRPGLDALLEGTPWVDRMLAVDMRGVAGLLGATRRLRGYKSEAALLLPNSFRSALAVRLSGIGIRVGYDRDLRGSLLTHRVNIDRSERPIPLIEYYRRLCRSAFGFEEMDCQPALFVTQQQAESADSLLQDVKGPFVLLNPGGNKPPKRWPAERFAAVADALRERRGLSACVSGSPAEHSLVRQVVESAASPITNLAARGLTLGTLKAIMQRAALLITNDTGPRHIAAALGTPVVSLFGPTDHRWTTWPSARERILLAEPFLPGQLVADDHPKSCSIERISVADVVFAAERLLEDRAA
jgi:heptosyltransferase-2